MMRYSIFDLKNGGRLIHEVDLYTSKYGTYKNDLLNSFNHIFNHMALEPECGALRPGALQLGGAQTGYRFQVKK